MYHIVDCLIMIIGGLICFKTGFNGKFREDWSDTKIKKTRKLLKILGPILFVIGILRLLFEN